MKSGENAITGNRGTGAKKGARSHALFDRQLACVEGGKRKEKEKKKETLFGQREKHRSVARAWQAHSWRAKRAEIYLEVVS